MVNSEVTNKTSSSGFSLMNSTAKLPETPRKIKCSSDRIDSRMSTLFSFMLQSIPGGNTSQAILETIRITLNNCGNPSYVAGLEHYRNSEL
jgi:hypothetical protein